MKSYRAIGRVLKRRRTVAFYVVNDSTDEIEMLSKALIITLIRGGDVFYTEIDSVRTPINVVSGPLRGTFLRSARSDSIEDNILSLPRY